MTEFALSFQFSCKLIFYRLLVKVTEKNLPTSPLNFTKRYDVSNTIGLVISSLFLRLRPPFSIPNNFPSVLVRLLLRESLPDKYKLRRRRDLTGLNKCITY